MDYNNSKYPQKHKNITKKNNNNSNQHHYKNREKGDFREHKRNYNHKQNDSNVNREIQEKFQWDFDELAINYPPLNDYVFISERGRTTIDWTNTVAHKTLNQAILSVQFQIRYWDMPEDQLIPTIPSRLNYLEWINKKLQSLNKNSQQQQVKIIDIGTGASVIYPILGASKYGWTFIATELSEVSFQNAKKILNNNPQLNNKVDLRKSQGSIFKDIIQQSDGNISFSMCNPPFFSEHEEKKVWINAQMKENEYICDGGELGFLKQMFEESKIFANQINVFTSLVGKQTSYEQFILFLKQQNIQNLNEASLNLQKMSNINANQEGDKLLQSSQSKQNSQSDCRLSNEIQEESQHNLNDINKQNDTILQKEQLEEQNQNSSIKTQPQQQENISNEIQETTVELENNQVKDQLNIRQKVQIFEGSIIQGNTTRWIVGWKFE